MKKNNPLILNIYKPAGPSSQDVIRNFKPRLKSLGKVGHFGTLDPFAEGVLMLGISGGQRLNEFIHECLPKTYLAVGILGAESDTGDLTSPLTQEDNSEYLKNVISSFEMNFIEKNLQEKFLGDYYQAPHKYSAAKFDGKALHKWAREGVEIKKEKKRRYIYSLKVIKYEFPKIYIQFSVSSGTYIRTLFSDCAKQLGTLGVLESLIREKVGGCTIDNALKEKDWCIENLPFLNVDEVLPFKSVVFSSKELHLYRNGVKLKYERAKETLPGELKENPYFWVRDELGNIYGLCELSSDTSEFVSRVNFAL